MNVIVRKRYPASKLPADLRDGPSEDASVEIQIARETTAPVLRIADLVGTGPNVRGDERAVLGQIAAGREDR